MLESNWELALAIILIFGIALTSYYYLFWRKSGAINSNVFTVDGDNQTTNSNETMSTASSDAVKWKVDFRQREAYLALKAELQGEKASMGDDESGSRESEDKEANQSADSALDSHTPGEVSTGVDKTLRNALIRRTIAALKMYFPLQQEREANIKLYQERLLSEDLFHQYQNALLSVHMELDEIQKEAESMQAGWGKGVFERAAQLIGLERQREAAIRQERDQEKKAKRDEQTKKNREKHEQLVAEQKREKAERLAEKMYQELMTQEAKESESAKRKRKHPTKREKLN